MLPQVIVELAELQESRPVVVTQLGGWLEVQDGLVEVPEEQVALRTQLFGFWVPRGNLKESTEH